MSQKAKRWTETRGKCTNKNIIMHSTCNILIILLRLTFAIVELIFTRAVYISASELL